MDDHLQAMPHARLPVPAHKTELPAPPPPTLLSRSRLLRLVAPPGEAEPHATLVCAPAGSGKTTLLATVQPTVSALGREALDQFTICRTVGGIRIITPCG